MNLHNDISKELRSNKSANCLKRLVSGNKYRYQNADFNLDLVYITSRIIAMGFPSMGYETLYRNEFSEVLQFFMKRHNARAKIYNLCEEDKRLYDPSLFTNMKVANFPFKDHNPCRIELMYDFAVDAFLFLQRDKENVIAVHCKAGKGRTGLMICAYLIFMEYVQNAQDAIDFFNSRRAVNGKGITIPSQLRYLFYFEHFLRKCIGKPYVISIEKFLKTPDLISNLHLNQNSLELKQICIGPLNNGKGDIKVMVSDFDNDEIFNSSKLKNNHLHTVKTIYTRINANKVKEYFVTIEFFGTLLQFEQDFRIAIIEKSRSIKFYYWLNANYISQLVNGYCKVESIICQREDLERNLLPKNLEDSLIISQESGTKDHKNMSSLQQSATEIEQKLAESFEEDSVSDLEEELKNVIEDIKIVDEFKKGIRKNIPFADLKRETIMSRKVNKDKYKVFHVSMTPGDLDKFSTSKFEGWKELHVFTTFVSEIYEE